MEAMNKVCNIQWVMKPITIYVVREIWIDFHDS